MSEPFCTPKETRVARKQHRCMSCGQFIEVGVPYVRWCGFQDGSASTHIMHTECFDSHEEACRHYGDGSWEYTLYGHERPEVCDE